MLSILNVAFPFAPVGPDGVGGAEQIVAALDRFLVEHGHRSIVLARADSQVHGQLVPLATHGLDDDTARANFYPSLRRLIASVADRERVDLVHLHGIDFPRYVPAGTVPLLATLHLPLAWYPPEALAPVRPAMWLHGVSSRQCAAAPAGAELLPPIGNGVALGDYARAPHARRGYALCLGRICPEKGYHLALEAAHRAEVSLLIGGAVFPYPAHQAHFKDEILPRLDRRRRWLGPLGLARKRRLLAGSRCLVVPSLVEETSSLVAMEALACGTPVLAFRRGALQDIVEPGRTGWLVDSVQEMAEVLRAGERLDPAVCRAAAAARFSVEHMGEAYVARYAELAAR